MDKRFTMKYLIIDEDGETYLALHLTNDILEAFDAGIYQIIDISMRTEKTDDGSWVPLQIYPIPSLSPTP